MLWMVEYTKNKGDRRLPCFLYWLKELSLWNGYRVVIFAEIRAVCRIVGLDTGEGNDLAARRTAFYECRAAGNPAGIETEFCHSR